MKKIFDRKGHLIGIFNEQSGGAIQVFDANYNYLGRADERGTFDRNWSMITRENLPALLLDQAR